MSFKSRNDYSFSGPSLKMSPHLPISKWVWKIKKIICLCLTFFCDINIEKFIYKKKIYYACQAYFVIKVLNDVSNE